MKKLLGALLVLFFAAFAFAEIDIPVSKRVKNYDSGVCVWCAVENLANVHGITQLHGIAKYRHDNYGKIKVQTEKSYIVDQHGNWIPIEGQWTYRNDAPGTPSRVRTEFKRLNVNYKMQEEWNYDTAILKEAVDKNLGCAVGLMNYPKYGNYHMVTLTDLNDKEFLFVDNNGECSRYRATREWFNQHWTGYTILIYPAPPAITEERQIQK